MKNAGKSNIKWVMNMLIILPVFILIGCKENKRTSQQNMMVHTETIQAVKVFSAGGELGFSSNTVINKDSIHYTRTMAANEANNRSYSRKVKPEDWKNLVDKIDLKMFGGVKEGYSVQPVDGIDTKIIITTSAGEISKMNAHNDPEWRKILDDVEEYGGKYK